MFFSFIFILISALLLCNLTRGRSLWILPFITTYTRETGLGLGLTGATNACFPFLYFYKKEFLRKGSISTVDHHKLPFPVSARSIRFHPVEQHVWNCLRVEVYGIDGEF